MTFVLFRWLTLEAVREDDNWWTQALGVKLVQDMAPGADYDESGVYVWLGPLRFFVGHRDPD